ncbi:MAG: DNA translocase FtsK 4TM domain-containing protein [Salinibacter sp.]|uniref:DNA translocase FtsK n=1 Tax=Salinibacter sp. TaxID=2065818 RepID=UPI0035D45CC8
MPNSLLPPRRKAEVLGLILMVLGLLLSLAFLTYHAGDASTMSLSTALVNPGEVQAESSIQNLLGPIGAQIAQLLVPGFLGYGILAWSSLVMVWGYSIFRHQPVRRLLYPSLLTLLSVFVFACFMGWFDHALDTTMRAWAGAVGVGVAGWMQYAFGMVGSFILLFLTAAVLLLVAVDHDIQRTVDRIVEGPQRLASALGSGWTYAKHQWVQARSRADAENNESPPPRGHDSPSPSSSSSSSQQDPAPDEEEQLPPSSPVTLQVPDAPESSRPLRRNDLFRSDTEGSTEQHSSPAGESSGTPSDEADPDARLSDAASPPSSTDALEDPEPSSEAEADGPEEDSETSSSPQPEALEEGEEVSMTIQKQVEEETTDEIERPVETPEDFEYDPPPLGLLDEAADDPAINREELEENKRILLDKLDTYNIEIDDINAVVGPTVTRYELTPAPGIKISRIKSLEDDLAMAMAASGIRIIAPIPGKSAVGVEIPNRNRELVRLREVIGTTKFQEADMTLPLPLGKTIEGEVFLDDLTEMPHLLIAGATGSGKSVGLNAYITGLIYACHPANLRFVIIDPKKIELQQYTPLDTQFVAVPEDVDETVITDVEKASGVLKSVEREMETRYDLLSEAGVRNIQGYNEAYKAGELDPSGGHRHMPYLVVVVDELADLMMAGGDEVEGPISRLAQMARAVGIHLVLATQRPSVDVITGLIKANFSSRVAYEVASQADSRTILDQGGAEGLVGNGDLLFLSGSDLRRLQGPFVSVTEVERIVEHVADQPGVTPYTLPSLDDAGHGPDKTLGVEGTDDKFEEAARVIVRRQQGSVSLLQRKLAVGYTRAARIVDQLEEAGIVGPFNGTKAREVLVDDEEELDALLHGEEESEAPDPSPDDA